MNPYRLDDGELERLLNDDAPCGDATTLALGIGRRPGRLVFRARSAMTVCGSEEAARMGALRDLATLGDIVESGTRLAAGAELLTLAGPAASLHLVWKTAQTLIEYLSGIATRADRILEAARRANPAIAVACTRKNFPGTKAASIKAILCAGATPHRLGLSDTILVFAEHRAFLGDETPAATVARLRGRLPERAVVVEVGGADEALRWAEAGTDIVQLEKRTPDEIVALAQAFAARRLDCRIAAAGGINADNAETYARAGAAILVTSAPYFGPPAEVAITLEPERS